MDKRKLHKDVTLHIEREGTFLVAELYRALWI